MAIRIDGKAIISLNMKPVENMAVIKDFIPPKSKRKRNSVIMYTPITIGMLDIPRRINGIGKGKRFSRKPSTIEREASIETIFVLSGYAIISIFFTFYNYCSFIW